MSYNLFIDDLRNPDFAECIASGVDPSENWHIVRSVKDAKSLVKTLGMPAKLVLDHDLGENDQGQTETIMDFLKWLANVFWTGHSEIPEYTVHSSNPAGVANIRSFMESWKKAAKMS